MKKHIAIVSLSLALGGFTLAAEASGHQYKIDPSHSEATFKVRHLGISWVSGRFDKLSGGFFYNPEDLSQSTVSASIEAASVDTDVERRDNHLRSADFFDASQYPDLRFESRAVRPADNGQFQIEGDLTIRGVTRPVVLDAELGGTVKDPWGNERAAFSASTRINRKDFGLTWNQALEAGGLLVGEEVQIEINVEGIRAKSGE